MLVQNWKNGRWTRGVQLCIEDRLGSGTPQSSIMVMRQNSGIALQLREDRRVDFRMVEGDV